MSAKKELRQVSGFSASIRALAFDGAEVLAGLADGEVVRVADDGTLTSITKHPRPISALAGTPGNVASVSEGLLRVTGSVPKELDRHVGAVATLTATDLVLGVERSVLVVHDGAASRISSGHRDDVTALAVVPADDTRRSNGPARVVAFSRGVLERSASDGRPRSVE